MNKLIRLNLPDVHDPLNIRDIQRLGVFVSDA